MTKPETFPRIIGTSIPKTIVSETRRNINATNPSPIGLKKKENESLHQKQENKPVNCFSPKKKKSVICTLTLNVRGESFVMEEINWKIHVAIKYLNISCLLVFSSPLIVFFTKTGKLYTLKKF